MARSLTKIFVHGTFGTKAGYITIPQEHEQRLIHKIKHILEADFKCLVKNIYTGTDHIHVIFILNPTVTLHDVFQHLLTESSNWWNRMNLTSYKFIWQTGYAAFSLGEPDLKEMEVYLANQREYHKNISFEQEFNLLVNNAYGSQAETGRNNYARMEKKAAGLE